jgi:hypothetical protein
MRARGLRQTEVAARGHWHTSNLSRIVGGRVGLSPQNRRTLADVLQCSEATLIAPIGSPVPGPLKVTPQPPPSLEASYEDRIGALLDLIGVSDATELVPFLLGENYAQLPERTAKRLREAVAARRKRRL